MSFIPDLGGWTPADLMRLSWDIEYREKCYRAANPDTALEDALSDKAKGLLQHGKKIANAKKVRVSDVGLDVAHYEAVAALIDRKAIASSSAAPLLEALIESPKDAASVATDLGLMMIGTDDEIAEAVNGVWADNPKPLQDYLGGKESALGAVIGMVMKRKKGLDPAKVRAEIIKRKPDDK
jgi:Asp-tRNA(Asn)/Glu-tRNA(Gln) amidotransferase B subunit